MEAERPSYYAILEADVRYDKKLSSTAKLIYAEITALTQKEGYAWASNKYFADNFGLSKTQVSRIMSQLVEAGYIHVDVKQNYSRKITLRKNVKGGTQKAQTPLRKNRKRTIQGNNIINKALNMGYKTPAQMGMPDLSS